MPTRLGRNAAVAWKPGEAAGRAIEAAPDDQLTRLKRAGVATRVTRFQAGGHLVGTSLIDQAHAAGADLLVMGAYRHGRTRELILGGVTQDILASADLPLLLHH